MFSIRHLIGSKPSATKYISTLQSVTSSCALAIGINQRSIDNNKQLLFSNASYDTEKTVSNITSTISNNYWQQMRNYSTNFGDNNTRFEPNSSLFPNAHVKSMEEYKKLYDESISNPSLFWEKQAKSLHWFKDFDYVQRGSLEKGDVTWFGGGKLNACYNCVDRHLENQPDKVALIWEGDTLGQTREITYAELFSEVCKLANVLRKIGVKKGDSVAIYMPMVPEAVFAMLACTRIGAIHTVVFAGFSADALRSRISDSGSKFIITANEGVRGGRIIPLKAVVDEAILGLDVQNVIVHKRTEANVPMHPSRDFWMHEAMEKERGWASVEWMEGEEGMMVLHTSGSTSTPKGLLHSTAPYLLYSSFTHRLVFDLQPSDVYACVADIGWITGHTYVVYGPLSNGATTVLFESLPTFPDASRYWELIERRKITKFYTAPTAIRALMKFGDEPVKKHDLSSLKVLGTVGEPINPEAWEWYYHVVGGSKCSIVDTYWQTETGGHIISNLPAASGMAMKPSSASLPLPGIKLRLLSPTDLSPLPDEGEASGLLCVEKPWPGLAKTVLGDHQRYLSTYLSHKPYYFTGDGCFRDKDGYYWITGRVDDVITKAGHRLGTAEIESALVRHYACMEAAVVAIPDDVKGEAIVAFCITKGTILDEDATRKELKYEVRKRISAIAQPDRIILASGLPKTRSGKIMRRLLRKIAENKLDDLGDTSTLAEPDVITELIAAATAK